MSTPGRFFVMTALLFLLCIGFVSCGSIGTIKGSVSNDGFQQENQPARDLSVVVFLPRDVDVNDALDTIYSASELLFMQTGIQLTINDIRAIEWRTHEANGMIYNLIAEVSTYRAPYDLAISFATMNAMERLQYFFVGTWEGMIDNFQRRFIILRRTDPQVLLHELCHAFLLHHDHSGGIMAATTFYLIPGVVSLNRSNYLLEKDRREILKNKWRDFTTRLSLARPERGGTQW